MTDARTQPVGTAPDDRLATDVTLACVLEATAPKPGNVTPAHAFPEMTFADLVRSALALGPALGDRPAATHSVGRLIEDGVRATARVSPVNTNLGIVLLFAPLVRAAATRGDGETLRDACERVLAGLDVGDAAAAFAAIAAAAPGGLGDAREHDVRAPARVSLRAAMATAADRDSIAAEYARGYPIVFDTGLGLLGESLSRGRETLDAIVDLHVGLLAVVPDTLIARKAGWPAAREVSAAAREVRAGRLSLAAFDARLRADTRDAGAARGHRLNPGTTADIVAATLLAALLEGMVLR